MSAQTARREFAKTAIDMAIRKALKTFDRKRRRTFADLIWKIQYRSDLLRPGHHAGCVNRDCLDRVVDGLRALIGHRRDWLRPVEDWEPRGSTSVQIFSSLAHHLLANFPVPPVLLSAWFRGDNWGAWRCQGWFRRAGSGMSLREIGLPIPLTKRMAHEFAEAPDHFPIEYALRWAQVRGLGGSDPLAHVIASTRLRYEFMNNDFWVSLFHLFFNTPRLDLSCVRPLVDYLHQRKFVPEQVIIGEATEIALGPIEPDLSIKGRTVDSLMRRVEEWQAGREKAEVRRRFIQWRRSPFQEFQRIAEGDRVWTIRELLDSNALADEGKAMEHCVAQYTANCSRRKSTIWSLALESPAGRERLVTIEVDPETKRIVQASMKSNDPPDESSMVILKEWADREGLVVEV